jgi:preprotein translocase subunit SecG
LGPIFVGALSDMFGLATALSFLPIFTAFAAILYFIGSFYYKRDLEAVERIDIEFEDR